MKKYTLLLLALLISSLCFSQTDFLIRVRDPIFKSVVITQEKTIPNIKVKPGETIDYHLPSGQNIGFAALTIDAPLDTTKKWIFKISVVEDTGVIPVPVVPILIQAENVTSIVNAAVVGTIIGNITSGAVIKYAAVDMGTRTKIKFRYSRGYTGSGSITFKVGSTSSILTFPSTGSWSIWQDIEFTIPSASGVIEINSSVIGPCNIDNFSIY